MIELNPESLLTILPPKTIKKLWKFCNEGLVYFPSKPLEYEEIKKQYKRLLEDEIKHNKAVEILSKRFNKTYKTIDKIVKCIETNKILD